MSVVTVTQTIHDRAFMSYSPPRTAAPKKPLPAQPSTSIYSAPARKQAKIQVVELPTEVETYTRNSARVIAPGTASAHRHSRTVSSALLPQLPTIINAKQQIPPNRPSTNRRQQSSSLPSQSYPPTSYPPSSYTASGPNVNSQANMATQISPQRAGTHTSIRTSGSINSLPRRSTSNRSVATNSPSSYVTLMRKQKATVWCDRAQAIDARLAAQQKAAKQRANLEVVHSSPHSTISTSGRTSTLSTGGLVSKVRHSGGTKTNTFDGSRNLSGVNGIPTRLVTSMMGDEEDANNAGVDLSSGRVMGDNPIMHARTPSGRSSLAGKEYRSGYPKPREYSGMTPPDGNSPGEGIPETEEGGVTPRPLSGRNQLTEKGNYFESQSRAGRRQSLEEEGDHVGEMRAPNAARTQAQARESAEDLRRRGSVDERTATMRGPRLFVANPDND